jgi:adenine phosphoribosyltransferase
MDRLKKLIRDIPDFPKPGILFRDITPLLADGAAFREITKRLAERAAVFRPERIVAVEARGFLFGAALAHELGVGLVPVRKPGKLPWKTSRVEYALEYGSDALEMHHDALGEGVRALVVDDVLATGGTAAATARLVAGQGAIVAGLLFPVEFVFLNGRDRLAPYPVDALITY